MPSVDHLISRYDQERGAQKRLLEEVQELTTERAAMIREVRNQEDAQTILQFVAQQTQQELEFNISSIVSAALAAVFDDPYEFKLEFVQRRNKTEAELSFVRDGGKVDPMGASGGGAVDVASFALRVALWRLAAPRPNNTIILDEPFRFLSRELQPKAGEMLKMLSKEMKIQFLIVTHNQDLINAADKVFEIKMKKGVSHVVQA